MGEPRTGETVEGFVDAGSGFGRVLRLALDLPDAEQIQLATVLMQIHGAVVGDSDVMPIAVPDEAAPAAEVAAWLATIASEPAWVQLRAIDVAIDSASDQEELEALRAARESLVQAFPGVAVRANVEGYAREHPVMTFVGFAGLVLAVLGAFRGVFRLIF